MASILIADDVALARDNVARALRDRGHKVTTAADGQEALDRFARERFDLMILDMLMPRVSGLDACVRMKSTGGPFTPVIFVSARADVGARVSALAVGEDFIAKPYDLAELCARVDAHLRTRRALEDARARGATEAPGAARAVSDPRPALATDTGLLDRALFVDRVADEWRRSERTTDPMALIVAGIDGPDAAQGVSALANTFARCLRGIDILGRSDERHVAALLLNTHVTGVMSAVTRMRAELRRLAGDGALAQTTSIGASFHPSREVAEPADLLKLAERAIARAREEGPGRICFWQHAGYLFDPPETP